MSVADEAKEILDKLGLHWPDGDPGKLRDAASAWRTFADTVDEVRTPVNNAAKSVIHHNKGEAVDAFEVFWSRYVGDPPMAPTARCAFRASTTTLKPACTTTSTATTTPRPPGT